MLPNDLRDFTAPRLPWMGMSLLALALIAMSVEFTSAAPAPTVTMQPDCPRTHPWGRERLRLMVATKHRDADKWAVQCFYGSYYSATARFAP